MDLPIVMQQPVTWGDRGRWVLNAIIGVLVAFGLASALPWVRYIIHHLPLGIPANWGAAAYSIIVVMPVAWAFFELLRAVFYVDRTWIVDQTAIIVRSRYIIGQRTRIWPLDRITKVRVHDVETDESQIRYCVEIQLAGRWHSVRCYLASTQAWVFRNLIDEMLTARGAR